MGFSSCQIPTSTDECGFITATSIRKYLLSNYFGNGVTKMNRLFYCYDFTPPSNKITRNITIFHILKHLTFG